MQKSGLKRAPTVMANPHTNVRMHLYELNAMCLSRICVCVCVWDHFAFMPSESTLELKTRMFAYGKRNRVFAYWHCQAKNVADAGVSRCHCVSRVSHLVVERCVVAVVDVSVASKSTPFSRHHVCDSRTHCENTKTKLTRMCEHLRNESGCLATCRQNGHQHQRPNSWLDLHAVCVCVCVCEEAQYMRNPNIMDVVYSLRNRSILQTRGDRFVELQANRMDILCVLRCEYLYFVSSECWNSNSS